MYEATASCTEIARAPVTNWAPQCVTLAAYRLRREARDESWARNSILCQSLATLQRYGTQ